MERKSAPSFLNSNKKKWTDNYAAGAVFTWHNKSDEILKLLKLLTASHCAFCDDVLIPKGSDAGEIEHFKPKGKYKELAYEWTNLYPICRHCNGTKSDRFNNLLLRPDEKGFEFSEWFRYDPITFKIKPARVENIENIEWKRAKKTIELYGFNKPKKIDRRQYEYDEIINNKYQNKDNQPFRFI